MKGLSETRGNSEGKTFIQLLTKTEIRYEKFSFIFRLFLSGACVCVTCVCKKNPSWVKKSCVFTKFRDFFLFISQHHWCKVENETECGLSGGYKRRDLWFHFKSSVTQAIWLIFLLHKKKGAKSIWLLWIKVERCVGCR